MADIQEDDTLRVVLYNWLRVPIRATLPSTHGQFIFDPIVQALRKHGVTTIGTFLSLSDQQITALTGPTTVQERNNGQAHPLLLAYQVKIRQAQAFYHYKSREVGAPCDPTTSRDEFDKFIIELYSGSSQIVPWHVSKPSSLMTSLEFETERFTKAIKLSKLDYPEFKTESSWQTVRESFETTAKAQGMDHVLNRHFVVTNRQLDKHQLYWMFSVLKDKMKEAKAKTIVTGFIPTRNARACWAALEDHFKNDVTAEIKCQQLSTFLTSNRSLRNGKWRGKDGDYILKWKETARQYNELSSSPYTETQLVQFLKSAMAGIPYLQSVESTMKSSRRVAGLTGAVPYSELIQSLLNATDVEDETKKSMRGIRTDLRINAHELLFEDEEDEGVSYELHTHDMDTDVTELLEVNQQEQRRRFQGRFATKGPQSRDNSGRNGGRQRAFMPKSTWTSLSQETRTGWSKFPEGDKLKILQYAQSNKTPFTQTRTANTHAIESNMDFEDEPESSKISVGVHDRTVAFRSDIVEKGQDSKKDEQTSDGAQASSAKVARSVWTPTDILTQLKSEKYSGYSSTSVNALLSQPSCRDVRDYGKDGGTV